MNVPFSKSELQTRVFAKLHNPAAKEERSITMRF
jgi:hypothetical protein